MHQDYKTRLTALSDKLGVETIAEGVETPGQVLILQGLGCDEAQGYYFGYPEPASSFAEKWLRASAEETRR